MARIILRGGGRGVGHLGNQQVHVAIKHVLHVNACFHAVLRLLICRQHCKRSVAAPASNVSLFEPVEAGCK